MIWRAVLTASGKLWESERPFSQKTNSLFIIHFIFIHATKVFFSSYILFFLLLIQSVKIKVDISRAQIYMCIHDQMRFTSCKLRHYILSRDYFILIVITLS
jgi:hypothetical protein